MFFFITFWFDGCYCYNSNFQLKFAFYSRHHYKIVFILCLCVCVFVLFYWEKRIEGHLEWKMKNEEWKAINGNVQFHCFECTTAHIFVYGFCASHTILSVGIFGHSCLAIQFTFGNRVAKQQKKCWFSQSIATSALFTHDFQCFVFCNNK